MNARRAVPFHILKLIYANSLDKLFLYQLSRIKNAYILQNIAENVRQFNITQREGTEQKEIGKMSRGIFWRWILSALSSQHQHQRMTFIIRQVVRMPNLLKSRI